MASDIRRIDAPQLKAQLHDGGEIALLDAREEGVFARRHLLVASCVPLGRLELLVDDLVPRRSARVVWCDDEEGSALRAAERMSALGYQDVAVLKRRYRGLGSSRLSPLQRRPRSKQGVRRGCRARGRHALSIGTRAQGTDRQRRRHRDFRQPFL